MGKVICFHGTDQEAAWTIRAEGFRVGTFFAKHLEDALEYGGNWVFQVCFDEERIRPGCWQFIIKDVKPYSDVVSLTHYRDIKKFYENADLRRRIYEQEDKTLERDQEPDTKGEGQDPQDE